MGENCSRLLRLREFFAQARCSGCTWLAIKTMTRIKKRARGTFIAPMVTCTVLIAIYRRLHSGRIASAEMAAWFPHARARARSHSRVNAFLLPVHRRKLAQWSRNGVLFHWTHVTHCFHLDFAITTSPMASQESVRASRNLRMSSDGTNGEAADKFRSL